MIQPVRVPVYYLIITICFLYDLMISPTAVGQAREGSLYIHILIVSSFVYCILFFYQPVRATLFIQCYFLKLLQPSAEGTWERDLLSDG